METWHDRLQKAMTVRRKTWAALVEATGLKKPSVYAWKPNATKRTEMMDGLNSSVVCHFLQINCRWLFLNEGPSGLEPEFSSTVFSSGTVESMISDLAERIAAESSKAVAEWAPGQLRYEIDKRLEKIETTNPKVMPSTSSRVQKAKSKEGERRKLARRK
jgi:hypothetical protein